MAMHGVHHGERWRADDVSCLGLCDARALFWVRRGAALILVAVGAALLLR